LDVAINTDWLPLLTKPCLNDCGFQLAYLRRIWEILVAKNVIFTGIVVAPVMIASRQLWIHFGRDSLPLWCRGSAHANFGKFWNWATACSVVLFIRLIPVGWNSSCLLVF
jgi:hypothetical protein